MRIVLVEDEARLARSYARNLEDEGHIVEVLHDGDAAYARLSQGAADVDVAILDVRLPGRDGITLCRDLRREGLTLPILLLTALDQTENKVAGLDAGADDYLTKPFPFEELLARLRALGRRSPTLDSRLATTQLQVGDLVIDLLRHEVYRGEAPVRLTAREFELLVLLARNANRVLPRQQLIARIWQDGTEAGSNVLETYIRYLRTKVDRAGEESMIATVRGVGYMLRPPPERGTRGARSQ